MSLDDKKEVQLDPNLATGRRKNQHEEKYKVNFINISKLIGLRK